MRRHCTTGSGAEAPQVPLLGITAHGAVNGRVGSAGRCRQRAGTRHLMMRALATSSSGTSTVLRALTWRDEELKLNSMGFVGANSFGFDAAFIIVGRGDGLGRHHLQLALRDGDPRALRLADQGHPGHASESLRLPGERREHSALLRRGCRQSGNSDWVWVTYVSTCVDKL